MRNVDLGRLLRYAISGGASAATHFGLGLLLSTRMPPVAASTIGFAASVLVSYTLQHAWVFRSTAAHTVAGGKFLTVTAAALGLNTSVIWLGTSALHAPYAIAQGAALVLIPVLNYSLNSRWTFRSA